MTNFKIFLGEYWATPAQVVPDIRISNFSCEENKSFDQPKAGKIKRIIEACLSRSVVSAGY